MNILMLSWRGPGHPLEGGAEQVMHEHAKAWIKAGHTVTLFTSSYQGAKKRDLLDGVEIIRSGKQFVDVQIRAFLWYLFGIHQKIDLVVDEFHGIPFFTPLYAIRTKKVAFIHEVAREVWKLNPWPKPYSYFPAIFGPLVEPMIFKLYKKVPFITVSQSTKQDLIELGIHKKNIEVIHNGFNKPRVKKFAKEISPTLIYLGAISKDKGIFDAIEVFNRILKTDDMWKFWIVGKGGKNEVEQFMKMAEKYGIKDKIKYWGYVTQNKKYELLSKAHVMINPSYHEGWGLVNIEANSVGTPVVAWNVHGCRDSIKDGKTGFLIEKGAYEKMSEKIIMLFNDKNAYTKFQKESIVWSQKHSWDYSVMKFLEIIEAL